MNENEIEYYFNRMNINKKTNEEKYDDFIRSSMANKKLQTIAGINDDIEISFLNSGITEASQILGQYLLFNRNNILFGEWLQNDIKINMSENIVYITECFSDWCSLNL